MPRTCAAARSLARSKLISFPAALLKPGFRPAASPNAAAGHQPRVPVCIARQSKLCVSPNTAVKLDRFTPDTSSSPWFTGPDTSASSLWVDRILDGFVESDDGESEPEFVVGIRGWLCSPAAAAPAASAR